jgi:hypothetical protein
MKSEWESLSIDELFALRDLMQEVLSEKLLAKKAALERRLQQLNQQAQTMKPDLSVLLMTFGHCGCAWNLLPLVSSL